MAFDITLSTGLVDKQKSKAQVQKLLIDFWDQAKNL